MAHRFRSSVGPFRVTPAPGDLARGRGGWHTVGTVASGHQGRSVTAAVVRVCRTGRVRTRRVRRPGEGGNLVPSRPVHRPDRRPRRARRRGPLLAALLLAIPLVAIPTTAAADPGAPWDGTPISAGLGPTYGEALVPADADPGTRASPASQGAPLGDSSRTKPSIARVRPDPRRGRRGRPPERARSYERRTPSRTPAASSWPSSSTRSRRRSSSATTSAGRQLRDDDAHRPRRRAGAARRHSATRSRSRSSSRRTSTATRKRAPTR